MKYRYDGMDYDPQNDDDMAELAMDIVRYDERPEEWHGFDEWLDSTRTASDLYRDVRRLGFDTCVTAELALEFALHMAANRRREVVHQGILDGTVEVIE